MSRVLIVDDDWRILQLLGDSLKQDYAVETVMNAGEALAVIQQRCPGLVLLDVILPARAGFTC